jgi:ArsR family transcriptional regulator, arsenate/arsenite/antimonite-responsive transcriptional repressor
MRRTQIALAGLEQAVEHVVGHDTGAAAVLQTLKEPLAGSQHFDYPRIMEETEVIKALAALAHPVRLKVFRALVVTGAAGLTPGTIAEALGIPLNTLSFHLKELTIAGLVTQERASRHIVYRAAYERMNGLLGYLTENCCAGAECAVETGASTACGC